MLDTNILISACWSPGGLEAQTLALAWSGAVQLCISDAVLLEYGEVLSRKKFASRSETIAGLLDRLREHALHVEPAMKVTAARDEDDNRFLECAEAADAAYLVTGNLRDYPPQWRNTRIVNAREFLNSLA